MSLHIYIAHTGEHFVTDTASFASYVPFALLSHHRPLSPAQLFLSFPSLTFGGS